MSKKPASRALHPHTPPALRIATRSRRWIPLAALALLACLALPLSALAQQYSVTEIPPAAGESAAPIGNAINASGVVTGFIGPPAGGGGNWTVGYNYPGFPNGQEPGAAGFFRYSSGVTVHLPSYNPNFFCNSNAPSIGIGINVSGQISGAVCATTENPTAFIYQNGTYTLIPRSPGALATWGTGINSAGQIVGTLLFPAATSCSGSANTYHTFLYDSAAGTVQDLGTFFGCSSYGAALNDSGQIVGTAVVNSYPHGYLYSSGTAVDIGNIFVCPNNPGFYAPYTAALAINASAQVTGYSSAACGAVDAFLYSASSATMQDIGNLGGPNGSQGNAINSSGQITGLSWTKGNAALHAFLYANGSMVDLNSLISSADATQYTLADGVAINDSGQIVVQGIKIATGQQVTVILTPVNSVPNVVGDTQDAATSALTAAALVVGTVTTHASTTVAPGLVISQDPVGGSSVTSGSTVNLVISSGVFLPNLVGLPLSAAALPAGLILGPLTFQYSSTVPQDVVIAQSPPGGSSVAGGTIVNLVLSQGPAPSLTQVPNVIGDTQSAATGALNSVGLILGSVTQQASTSAPLGEVLSQSPAAGGSVVIGSAVNLILSSGPPRVSIGLAGAPQISFSGSTWLMNVRIQNTGNVPLDSLEILSSAVNGTPAVSLTPAEIDALAPGSPAAIVVSFPATIGSGTLKLSGTYTAGTLSGNWTISARVAVPAVP